MNNNLLLAVLAALFAAGGFFFAELNRLEREVAVVRQIAQSADNDDVLRDVQLRQARVEIRLENLEKGSGGVK